LQVLQVLDGFEVVDFVFHVAANGFPMADGQRQAGALEFEAGEGFAVVVTDAHAVLAVDAVLGAPWASMTQAERDSQGTKTGSVRLRA
jgi:hypothetical protein